MEKISYRENFSIKLNALPQTIQEIDNIWCWRIFVIHFTEIWPSAPQTQVFDQDLCWCFE